MTASEQHSSVNQMSLQDQLEHIQLLFEGGLYRQTLEAIELALEEFPNEDELWLWQAIATEAIGDTAGAIAFAEPLTESRNSDTRQKAKYLIRIWSAPKLERSEELQPKMNSLDGLSNQATTFVASKSSGSASQSKATTIPEEPTQGSDQLRWPFIVIGLGASLLLTYFLIS